MADSDLMQLYSGRILGLAAEIPHAGRLDRPEASASRRAPLCGSTVTVDLVVRDGRVAEFAQDVRACALGQAAAAVLGAAVIGQDRSAIAEARGALAALLGGADPILPPAFADLALFAVARDYRNRHASILLALDATLEAWNAIAP